MSIASLLHWEVIVVDHGRLTHHSLCTGVAWEGGLLCCPDQESEATDTQHLLQCASARDFRLLILAPCQTRRQPLARSCKAHAASSCAAIRVFQTELSVFTSSDVCLTHPHSLSRNALGSSSMYRFLQSHLCYPLGCPVRHSPPPSVPSAASSAALALSVALSACPPGGHSLSPTCGTPFDGSAGWQVPDDDGTVPRLTQEEALRHETQNVCVFAFVTLPSCIKCG